MLNKQTIRVVLLSLVVSSMTFAQLVPGPSNPKPPPGSDPSPSPRPPPYVPPSPPPYNPPPSPRPPPYNPPSPPPYNPPSPPPYYPPSPPPYYPPSPPPYYPPSPPPYYPPSPPPYYPPSPPPYEPPYNPPYDPPYDPPTPPYEPPTDPSEDVVRSVVINLAVANKSLDLAKWGLVNSDYEGWEVVAISGTLIPNSPAKTVVQLVADGVVVASQTNPGKKLRLVPNTEIIWGDVTTLKLKVIGSTKVKSLSIRLR